MLGIKSVKPSALFAKLFELLLKKLLKLKIRYEVKSFIYLTKFFIFGITIFDFKVSIAFCSML